MRGDEINHQLEANQIYDMGVNAGISTGIKLSQRLLNVPETGIMDDQTLLAINQKK